MFRSVKFYLSAAAASLLLISLPLSVGATDRPHNEKVNEDDPVVMCQKTCQDEKNKENYEACMLKCKETHKSMPQVTQPEKK